MKLEHNAAQSFLNALTYEVLTPETFIDFDRIKEKVNGFEEEINALNNLFSTTSKLNEEQLMSLLLKYPEIISFLRDIFSVDNTINENFLIELLLSKNFGILFNDISDVKTLYIGSLLGLEVNKRKNKRGKIFHENVLRKIDTILSTMNSGRTSYYCKKEARIELSNDSKVLDALIYENNIPVIGVEINFYTTSGSKVTEIFHRLYPDLQQSLAEKGIKLLVVTDGKGWLRMRNTLIRAFHRLEYLCNLNQLEDTLKKTLCS